MSQIMFAPFQFVYSVNLQISLQMCFSPSPGLVVFTACGCQAPVWIYEPKAHAAAPQAVVKNPEASGEFGMEILQGI